MKTFQILLVPALAAVAVAIGLSYPGGKTSEVKIAPAAPTTSTPLKVAPKDESGVAWEASFEAAMARAKATKRVVMVDFHATWCGPCHMMDEQTYPDARVVAAARRFVSVKVDVDKRQDVASQYGVRSLPTTLWIRPDGKPLASAEGFVPPQEFASMMEKAHRKSASG